LQFKLDAALRQLWSRKSDKVSPEQLALFLSKLPPADSSPATEPGASDAQSPADSDSPPEGSDGKPDPKNSRTRPKKLAFPPDLPRRRQDVRVPDEERHCACGLERTCIGHEVQDVWEYEPGCFYLLQRFCEKLACKK